MKKTISRTMPLAEYCYAYSWWRLLDYLIDTAFLVLVYLLLVFTFTPREFEAVEDLVSFKDSLAYPYNLLSPKAAEEELGFLIANLLQIFAFMLYYFICEAFFNGKTLGKWIVGLKVVDINGNKPGIKKIAIRTLARLIPFEALTFINLRTNWAEVDNNNRYWHDSLTKTYVVRVKKIAEYRQLEAAGQNVITQEIDLPDDNGEDCADNQFRPGDKVFYAGDNRVMFVDKIMPDGNIHCIQIYANGEIESLGVYECAALKHNMDSPRQ